MSIATFPILTPVVRATALAATCLAAALILSPTGHALAGPNFGGVLWVHDTGLVYTDTSESYPSPPPNIFTVDNNVSPGIPADGLGWVWKVYAAFPDGSSPRLKALAFMTAFSANTHVIDAGLPDPVADYEVPQDGWPTLSGGSDGMAFGVTQTDQVDEVYWFAGYSYYVGATWTTATHVNPRYRIFVDDAVPPNEDAIRGYSSIGFGVDGYTVWPQPPEYGACCICEVCLIMTPTDCQAQGGIYQGNGTNCDPSLCALPPGACCLADGSCFFVPECACTGIWNHGTSCDPNPCGGVPVDVDTWGRIKARFR